MTHRLALIFGILIIASLHAPIHSQPAGSSHLRPVRAFEFNQQGNLLASAAFGSVKVWDTETGTLRYTLHPMDAWVTAAGRTPDGEEIVTFHLEGLVRVWRISDGSLLRTFRASPGTQSMTLAPNGEILATASDTGITIRRLAGFQKIRTFDEAFPAIPLLVFSPDSRRLFSAVGSTIQVRDVARGLVCTESLVTDDEITALAVSPDGVWLATGTRTGEIVAWNLRETTTSSPLGIKPAQAPFGSFDCFSAAFKSAQKGWLVENGRHTGQILSLSFSPDSTLLVSGGTDRYFQILDFETGALLMSQHAGEVVIATRFSPDGSFLVVSSADGRLGLYERTGTRRWVSHSFSGETTNIFFSKDGQELITSTFGAYDQKTLRMQRTRNGGGLHSLPRGGLPWMTSLAFSIDGERLAAGGQRGAVIIWDTADGTLLQRLETTSADIVALSFSPDGTQIVTAGEDSWLRLLDLEKGLELSRWRVEGAVESVTWSSDSKSIVSFSKEGVPATWDMETRSVIPASVEAETDAGIMMLRTLQGHLEVKRPPASRALEGDVLPQIDRVRAFKSSLDGCRLAATAGDERTIHLFKTDQVHPGTPLIDVSKPSFDVRVDPIPAELLFRQPLPDIRLIADESCGTNNDGKCVTRAGNLVLSFNTAEGTPLFLDHRVTHVEVESNVAGLLPASRAFARTNRLALGLARNIDLAQGDEILISGGELSGMPDSYGGGQQFYPRLKLSTGEWSPEEFYLSLKVYPRVKTPVFYSIADETLFYASFSTQQGPLLLDKAYESFGDSPQAHSGPEPLTDADSPPPAYVFRKAEGSVTDPAQPPSGAPVFRTSVNLVRVDCTVQDRQGFAVTDLERDDFRIFEEGVPRRITYFSKAVSDVSLPAFVVLAIDGSDSVLQKLAHEQAAARQFVEEVLRPGIDEVGIIQFDSSVNLIQEFTSHVGRLRNAIKRLRPGGGTALHDGIWLAAKELLREKNGRRILVVLSDGHDTASSMMSEEVERILLDSGVTIFAIGVQSEGYPAEFDVLKDLAVKSGGVFIGSTEDVDQLTKAFRTISRSIKAQYTLGYSLEDGNSNTGFREIDIKLSRRGARVSHRSGFYID